MPTFRVGFLTAAIFVLIAGIAQAQETSLPHGWLNFKPETGRFTIALPSKPTTNVQTVNEIAQNMKIAYYTAVSGDLMVVIGELYDLPVPPERFSESERRMMYTNFRDGLTNGIATSLAAKGVKLRSTFGEQRNVTLLGLEGFEQGMTLGNYKGRARLLLAPERIYIFCAVAFSGSKTGEIDTSFNSFEYTGRRKPTPAAFRDVALLSRTPF